VALAVHFVDGGNGSGVQRGLCSEVLCSIIAYNSRISTGRLVQVEFGIVGGVRNADPLAKFG